MIRAKGGIALPDRRGVRRHIFGVSELLERLVTRDDGVVAATVLQVGEVPPPLAAALTAKYDALVLPIDAGREDFLAEHGASVRAIVDAGRAPIDAKLMEALPNLGAIIHWLDGYET
ncbi:MAG: hypothetical protein QOE48_6572, partial [Mycobacterium sp.]|nr:hypothetical protein [Mycobacterium sp.]